MKLAIVRQKYTPFGGAERFVERALTALKAQGTDVTVVAREWSGEVQGERVDPFYLGRAWRDASFAHSVQTLIASGRFDLVQSHERIPGCHLYRAGDGVHATWLELRDAMRGGLAPLATALSPWHRYTLRAEAAMFRHPALQAVICNSRMVRDDIAHRFGVPNEKLHVIYNGVDLSRFHLGLRDEFRSSMRSLHGAGDRPVTLFVGSGFERKGLPALIVAMRDIEGELWVVGRDKNQSKMLALAQKFGVATRIRFFGGQQDVRPFYGAADVFALPTLYDPFPNAAIEAFACGLPVVTTPSCGAADVISDDNGRVVPIDDLSMLANAINTLSSQAWRLREASRFSVIDLSLAAMAAKLSALYASLLPHNSIRKGAPCTPR